MTVSGLLMAHQVAGKASRDAIFLSQFRTADLPAIVTVAAIVAVAASVAGSRILVRSGPHRVLPFAFGLSGALQFTEWVLLGHTSRLAACVIYLHVVAFGAVLISGFWSLMNESFDPRSAKELFGKVGGFGTIGGFCGGLMAERVAAWFGSRDVVLLLGALHLACAAMTWLMARTSEQTSYEAPRETRAVDAVQRYPFLLTLAGLVVLASSGAALLDFIFKAQATHTIGRGAPLLRFFSVYYTVTSLLTFLAQTFLARVCVKKGGLAATAGSLPMLISIGGLTGALFPAFPILAAIRGAETLTRGSLYRSAYELFYTAIAPADKRAVKPLIDVGADRAGDAIGSAGVSLMLVLAPGRYGAILALASAISLAAVSLATRLRTGYLHALQKSLIDRAVELDPSMVEDAATRSMLMQSVEMALPAVVDEPLASRTHENSELARPDPFLRRAADLRSGDASRAIRAAADTSGDEWALAPLLIDLLAWDEAMPAARDALIRMGARITGMLVDVLLDPERDFVIRRRLPRVLAYIPSHRSVDGLFAVLEDRRFEVRFYSGRALHVLLNGNPELNKTPDGVWMAVNRELSLQSPLRNSHRLLDGRGAQEIEWFLDDELRDRADRNLEHLFTLLALVLPVEAVRIAFRALHTEDAQLKQTAFEYLETATPPDTRDCLLPVLESDARGRSRLSNDSALKDLLASAARVSETLKRKTIAMETAR